METAVDLTDVYVTDRLAERRARPADYLQEKRAIQELAARMVDEPEAVLPHFVELAIKLTGGVSAGLSLYEPTPAPGVFRWCYLRGSLAAFENATTPREFSPCGITLDRNAPTLALRPERYYPWIAATNVAIPEVLLVPLYLRDGPAMGTLWIVAGEEGHFNHEHARTATELASFVGIAVKMLRTEQRLQLALEEQEMLTREMSHRVKNLFSMSQGLVRLTARSATSKEELSESLLGRFQALAAAHGLVRRNFSDEAAPLISDLADLITAIVKPHERLGSPRFTIDGPPIACGVQAANGIALVFHELVTNAAKYGSLASDAGQVAITWSQNEDKITFSWRERGGPAIATAPQASGFGSKLLRETVIRQFEGQIEHHWNAEGLTVAIVVSTPTILR